MPFEFEKHYKQSSTTSILVSSISRISSMISGYIQLMLEVATCILFVMLINTYNIILAFIVFQQLNPFNCDPMRKHLGETIKTKKLKTQ